MRFNLSIVVLFSFLIGCGPSEEKEKEVENDGIGTGGIAAPKGRAEEQRNDTLVIVDSELVVDPFGWGDNPLKKLVSEDSLLITYRILENRHIEAQIDTVFQLQIGKDFFEVYKAGAKDWLLQAEVKSDAFRTKLGIKTGMPRSQVESHLLLNESTYPDVIRLKALEVPQWLDFRFRNDTLREISFRGYVD